MTYAERTRRPPPTLTDRERDRVLKVTGESRRGFRDHVIISLALGAGLRQSEIIGLDFADVADFDRRGHVIVKRILTLPVFKGQGRASPADRKLQRVHLPDATYYKLEKWMRTQGGRFSLKGHRPRPVFLSSRGNRLSDRQVRDMWHRWQARAGFEHIYPFHVLRHTAISAVRARTGDIRVAQVFARHKNISTTQRYDHPSDEEIARAVKAQVA
jgi:integrase